jgi:hypothetical protein
VSLYYSPVYYGLNDVAVPEGTGTFAARIYYPSDEMEVRDVPIRAGIYPLIAFAHGDRESERGLCPPDITGDYKRWGAVLHLLARCGFVVVSVAVHDVLVDAERTAERIEAAVRWARASWQHRQSLHQPMVFYMDPDVMMAAAATDQHKVSDGGTAVARVGLGFGLDVVGPLGAPTALGVLGHSWGARAAARVAVRGQLSVQAIGSIAGSFDDNASIHALTTSGRPTLMIVGSDDFLNASSLAGLWNSLPIPKHQAMLQAIGHWDWFGHNGSIRPCDASTPHPPCPIGWQTASELVLAFMTKYLLNNWWRPPYLLGSPGGRPPLMQWYGSNGPCALKVRWNDPTAAVAQGPIGDITLGTWTADLDPW